jgi:hypothetical protein
VGYGNTKTNNMTSKPKVIKHLVALNLSKLTPLQAITDTNHYVTQMTGNLHFPNPTPSLASITAQSVILDKAYAFSLTRAKGSVAKSNTELKTLKRLLKALGNYVETEANADPDNAASIILTSGMLLKKAGQRPPKVFEVIAMKIPGSIKLSTKSAKGAIYIYERTTDPSNPNSWFSLGALRKVTYIDMGLVSGTRYFYRTAISIDGKVGRWSLIKDAVAL